MNQAHAADPQHRSPPKNNKDNPLTDNEGLGVGVLPGVQVAVSFRVLTLLECQYSHTIPTEGFLR